MRRRWLKISMMLTAAAAIATVLAASTGAAPRPSPIPLVLTFDGVASQTSCSAINDTPGSSRVLNDLPDFYTDGMENVSATLDDAAGSVNFQTNPLGGQWGPRRLMLAFCGTGLEDIVAADGIGYLFKASVSQTDLSLRALRFGGSTTTRRFYIQWPRSKAAWRLSWMGDEDGASGVVNVACSDPSAVSGGPACSEWTVVPAGVAKLQPFSTKGGLLPGNSLDMPFRMTLKVK